MSLFYKSLIFNVICVLIGHVGANGMQLRPEGGPPGVIISKSPDRKTTYIGSPSIIIISNGDYIASHDWFGDNPIRGNSVIYKSHNKGKTWEKLADIKGQQWSTLFEHKGDMYFVGVAPRNNKVLIRRSKDGGKTWTVPVDKHTGLLTDTAYSSAPTPVVSHNGRLWRAFETIPTEGYLRHFGACVFSVPENADLLEATNWTRTKDIRFDERWLNLRAPSWLEGNVVVSPDGRLVNILRLNSHPKMTDKFELDGGGAGIPRFEVAGMLEISRDGSGIDFEPARGFIHFPGASSKFTIRYDRVSKRYWSLVQKITNLNTGYHADYSPMHQRNVLSLISSADLRNWTEHYRVLKYGEGRLVVQSRSSVGFQYVDWVFDGNDIVAVSRTAWGAKDYHDANYMTFHRIQDFRNLKLSDSPPDLMKIKEDASK